MTHHIRQQHLHIELSGTEPDGQLMQRLIPDLLYEKLFPALEKVFDLAVPADKLLKIDRLEIDAGSIAIDRMDKDLAGSIIREIERVLNEVTGVPAAEQNTDGLAVLKNSHENTSGTFLHFLETGSMPWNWDLADKRPLHEVMIEAIREVMTGSSSQLFIDNFRQTLSEKNAIVRLCNQFPRAFLTELLSLITPPVSGLSAKILSSHEMQQFSAPVWDIFSKRILSASFTYFSGAEMPSDDGFRSYLLSTLPEKQAGMPVLAKMLNSATKHSERNSGHDIVKQIQKPVSDSLKETEPVYIRNAGLILLHPFLPLFFEGLNVAGQDPLKYPEKALQLLGFLVTGNLKTPEYDLVLPKILCGIPVNKPLTEDIEISDGESAEGLALLEAVIGHWEALRDTSPDGFRGSFLYRPGKLIRSIEGGWILQVETRTWDILMDQLPWGIAMIKLPWMKEMLRVEWNY